jgi:lysozyme
MFEPLYRLIRHFEGLKLKPYLCPAGVWTIGYGSTGADITAKHPKVTAAWAEARMQADAARFVREALRASPILAKHPDKLCAIADFCYNLGSARYRASTLRRRINEERWEEAGEELMKWVWGGGRKLPGLVRRRIAERELLLGVDQADD